ncbi:hypothetical protein MKW98_016128, partial [Papaver atlanticum]
VVMERMVVLVTKQPRTPRDDERPLQVEATSQTYLQNTLCQFHAILLARTETSCLQAAVVALDKGSTRNGALPDDARNDIRSITRGVPRCITALPFGGSENQMVRW